MSNQDYTLEIVSHHPKFNSKSLRQYYVDGINTVGVWGNEPFEIRFKNNTYQKVQVKITLDGTDILTGKPANTEVSKDMWVVNGYGTLSLKAWPEDNNGGASFVFTSADNSVAVHTHGDLSSRGIIAAAVFTEGHVEPIKTNWWPFTTTEQHHHHHHYHEKRCKQSTPYDNRPIWYSGQTTTTFSPSNILRSTSTSGYLDLSEGPVCTINNVQTSSVAGASDSYLCESNNLAPLESLVSVGAGEHVDQKITYVTGLIKPVFSQTVRVKYLWWDDLVEKLRTTTKAQPQPSGFPADSKKNIDLKGTPRIGEKKGHFRRVESQPVFERF